MALAARAKAWRLSGDPARFDPRSAPPSAWQARRAGTGSRFLRAIHRWPMGHGSCAPSRMILAWLPASSPARAKSAALDWPPHLTAQRSPAGCGAGRGDSAGAVWPDCGARGQSCTVAGACSTRGASADGSADPGLEFNPITVGDDRGVSFAKRLAGGFAAAMGVDGRAAGNGVDFVAARLPAAARAVSFDGGAAFGLTLEIGGRDTGFGVEARLIRTRIGGLRIPARGGICFAFAGRRGLRACDRTGRGVG